MENNKADSEQRRVDALLSYNILDTQSEQEFDQLTNLISVICDVPIALVSLVDYDRQWFKSVIGLTAKQTAREISFCTHAIEQRSTFIVEDAGKDVRFSENPLVTNDPNIRFYAGYPLIDPEGHALGTFCVIDKKPRKLSESQLKALEILGQAVVNQIIGRKNRELAERLNAALDQSSIIAITDNRGRIKHVNKAFCDISGYTADELLGQDHRIVNSGLHPKKFFKDLWTAIAEGKTWKGEIRNRAKNGKFYWVDTTIVPFIHDNGRAFEYVSIRTDISERKKREEELEKFFDLSLEFMCIASPDGRFVKINPMFSQVLGYTTEEMIATPFAGFIHPEDISITFSEIEKMSKGEKLINFQNRFLKKSGESIVLNWSASADADTGMLYATARDVTGDIARIKQLDELIALQNAILDGTEHSIVYTDKDGIIRRINKGAERMLGYTAEELVNKTTPGILHDPEQVVARAGILSAELGKTIEPGFDTFVAKARDTNAAYASEWTYIHKSGKRFPVWLSITCLRNSEGDIFGYMGIAQDMSFQKQQEAELLKAAIEAREAVKAKDAFLANMSHEIRTPMNAIVGFANLLSESTLTNEQSDYLRTIQIASDNLLSIINDILDVSKIEAGKIMLEKVPVNIAEAVSNVQAMLQSKAAEKGITLLTFVDDIKDLNVLADPTRLSQILVNIAGNAVKFTENGTVEIHARTVQPVTHIAKIEFRIKDTGIGIAEEKIHSIFDRFVQAENDTTRKYGGTGLGLSIARALVELHGSAIEVKSTVGVGTEFSFCISFAVDNSVRKQDDVSGNLQLHSDQNLKILLVEDNTLNQKLALTMLRKFGFTPQLAVNGKEAVSILEKESFDVVLMDLQMPEMDGYQATIHIRKVLNSSIPIIAMTAHSLVGERAKCIEVGMNEYVPKPFKPQELFTKIIALAPQNKSANDLSVINLTYLRSVSGGNVEFEKEMINMYLTQVPQDLNAIEHAIASENYKMVSAIAHKLASTFSIMGVNDSARLSYLENKNPQPRSKQELQSALEELKSVFRKSATEFNNLYK